MTAQVWQHWRAMVLAARPVVGTVDAAQDCASQAIVDYLEDTPPRVENLEALMVTIAKRRAIDEARGRVRARSRDERLGRAGTLVMPDIADDVADRCHARWADEQARRLLTPGDYELLQRVADGVPLAELALRAGVSRNALEVRLFRARRVVRAALAKAVALIGLVIAGVRRCCAPAAVAAPAVVAALALGTAGVLVLGASQPRLTLAPQSIPVPAPSTLGAPAAGARPVSDVVPRTQSTRRTAKDPAVPPPRVNVNTPAGGVTTERRDDGHHADGFVGQVLWCVQHLRIELHYQGCDDGSGAGGAQDSVNAAP